MEVVEVTGGCFCEALAYRAEVRTDRIAICHCRDCQRFSGSAFRLAAAVRPDAFVITKGAPKAFEKTAASGRTRRMLFCGECGSHIASCPPDPDAPGAFVSLRIATAHDFATLRPRYELWCRSKVGWMPDLAETECFDAEPSRG